MEEIKRYSILFFVGLATIPYGAWQLLKEAFKSKHYDIAAASENVVAVASEEDEMLPIEPVDPGHFSPIFERQSVSTASETSTNPAEDVISPSLG